jgi:hypothetical protein
MDDVPDWKPDPATGQRKVVLSKDVLRADDEDSISPQEYTQRLEQAEQDAREDLLAYLADHGESGLDEKRDRLKEREEKAKAAVSAFLEERRIAFQAARSADALAEQYGGDVACGDAHFVGQGRYKHKLPEADAPAHWRRDANALVAVTRDGDEVLRCSTETTFIALRNKALARHRRLEDPWRRKLKAWQFFHLRRSVCENILYELDLGRDPLENRQSDDELRHILTDDQRRLQWIDDELNPKRVTDDYTWEDCYEHLEELCEDLGIPCPYSSTDSLARSYRNWR